MPELLDILSQLYGVAWLSVAAALLVDEQLAARRERLAASDALLDNLGSALPVAIPSDELAVKLAGWRHELDALKKDQP